MVAGPRTNGKLEPKLRPIWIVRKKWRARNDSNVRPSDS